MNLKAFLRKLSEGKTGLFVLYTIGLAIILPYTLWYVNNPDTYQYISIARKISNGHFVYALNGYWSPLISWILAIPIFFGIDDIVSLKIVQIIIGYFTIDAWFRLCIQTGTADRYRNALGLIIIPFVLDYALLNPTADLLFLTLVLYFTIIILRNEWMNSMKATFFMGLLGAMMYFAKAYGFPLFISMLFCVVLISFFEKSNSGIVKHSILSLIIFLSISALWFIPLSIKYDHFTISEAGRFNLSKEVAPLPEKTMYLPVLNGPLLSPPDEFSISAWESPGDVLTLNRIRPLQSKEDFRYYLQIVKRNLLSIWYFDFRNQLGIVFTFLLGIFILGSILRSFKINRTIILLFLLIILFYGGYSLILVHTRYIWVCTWIMLLLSGWILERITKESKWNHDGIYFFFLLVLLLSVKRPIKEILFTKDADFPLLWIGKGISNPFGTMEIMYRPEKKLQVALNNLKQLPDFKGKIASLKAVDGERHIYSSCLFIVNEIGGQYYGPLDAHLSIDEMKTELQGFGISYLLVWQHENWKAEGQNWVKSIYTDENLGLKVFRLF